MSIRSITCPKCGFTSYNLNDIEQGYCVRCHDWTSPHVAKEPRNQMKRQIAPGLWEDREGAIHWSIPELLAIFELEDTSNNRAEVTRMIRELVNLHAPNAKITERERPD